LLAHARHRRRSGSKTFGWVNVKVCLPFDYIKCARAG
jgi:hypothetical protein